MKANYHIASYKELLAAQQRSATLPLRTVFLSFDGNNRESVEGVVPLLERHSLPCAFFLSTGALDNATLLSADHTSLCIDSFLRQEQREKRKVRRTFSKEIGKDIPSDQHFILWLKSLRPHFDFDAHLLESVSERLEVDTEEYLRTFMPYVSRSYVYSLGQNPLFALGAYPRSHTHPGHFKEFTPIKEEILSSCREVALISSPSPSPPSSPSSSFVPSVPFAFPHGARGVSRSLLRKMRREHPEVGLLFGSGGMRRDAEFIFNRISADASPSPWSFGSNIPSLLRREYLRLTSPGEVAASKSQLLREPYLDT